MDEHTGCECGVCKIPHFDRNNYFHGKMLGARDLADEQRYVNEKRWLINRAVIGWGVVCGLDVCLENGGVVVAPGLALDCCGHEILVCGRQPVRASEIADALGLTSQATEGTTAPKPRQYAGSEPPGTQQTYTPPPAGTQYTPPGQYPEPQPVPWALCLEYRECRTEAVSVSASCKSGDRGGQYNRIRDDYRLTIRPWQDACPEDHTEHECAFPGFGRGTQLHEALVAASLACPKCKDCECVLLATGTITVRPGQPPDVRLDDDHWKYRRIVYTNRLLAEVIRCLHSGLAHIEAINWTPGSHYGADEFLDRLRQEHLKVTFDQPMKPRTVTNVRSCRLSIFLVTDGSCPAQLLIPVDRIEYTERTATYYFDDDCIERELRAACKRLKKPADVELILHGSMIHNRQGRALDAELIDEFPTGNGVEGGEFIAYFTVGP